jgi:multidrug efflux pump subunit AcrA (membrane-fusion protein)
MNIMNNDELHYGQRNSPGPRVAALVAVGLVLFACNVYLLWRLQRLETVTSQWTAATSQQMMELRGAVSENGSTQGKKLEALERDLEEARRQADSTAGQAKIEAQRHAEQLARRLAEAQERQQKELTDIQQNAATANTKIDGVSSDVAATKSDVAATKSQLESTVADLKRVTGDMGVLSDRIATNGQELTALRTLGERNYFEFTVNKSKLPHKVANVQLWVKKTDPKRNRFTVAILADDKTVEKRDRTVNEPVQFYVSKARQPYELVVNQVTKDGIVGYLAEPKVEMARK